MSDLPVEGIEKKEAPLTVEERLNFLAADIKELARGVNVQAKLLESIIAANESVLKTYVALTTVPVEEKK